MFSANFLITLLIISFFATSLSIIKPAEATETSSIVYLTINSIQGNPNPQTGSNSYNTGNNQTTNSDNDAPPAKTHKTSSATQQPIRNPPTQSTTKQSTNNPAIQSATEQAIQPATEQTVHPTPEQITDNPPVPSATEQIATNLTTNTDNDTLEAKKTKTSAATEQTVQSTIEQTIQTTKQPVQSTQATTEPTTNNGALSGLAGYPTSTNQIDKIIAVMQENNLNLYRMSFNPTWMSGPHPYHPEYIQYYLDHTPSNWIIIVDRNHIYPPTEEGASTFRDNIDVARNSILQVAAAWPNNPRVWIEMGNEYVSTDFHAIFQGLIDNVRDAGYSNTLVVDKWNTAWSTAAFNDPLDSVYVGMHFYFNSWSVSGAISQMKTALSLGLKLVNTEVGADFNEASKFTESTVDEVNNFLLQCTELGVGTTIWMNENLANWQRYQQLSLTFP